MVHKKYTKKNGKVYGPYFYQNKRVGEKVVTTYIGKTNSEKLKSLSGNSFNGKIFLHDALKNKNNLFYFSVIALLILSSVFFYFYAGSPTGRASLEINDVFNYGAQISGNLSLHVKAGELLPADSVVRVKYGGQQKDFSLSDLILRDNLPNGKILRDSSQNDVVSAEKINGNFFAEGVNLSGTGEGYGLVGHTTKYPDVHFQLRIHDSSGNNNVGETSQNNSSSNNSGENNSSSTESNATGSGNENSGSGNSGTGSGSNWNENASGNGNSGNENSGSGSSSDTSQNVPQNSGDTSQNSQTSSTDISSQGSTTSTESSSTSSTGETNVASSSGTNGESSNTGSTQSSDAGISSGGVTGSAISESEYVVSGVASKNNSYELNIGNGKTAEVVADSVIGDNGTIDDSNIHVSVEGGVVHVTTDYSIEENGFGSEFLGSESETFLIALEKFGFIAENASLLSVDVLSQGANIVHAEKEIGVANVPAENKTENSTNEIIANSSVQLIKNIGMVRIAKDGTATLTMSDYFAGAERYEFAGKNIFASFGGKILTLTSDLGFSGVTHGTITAFGGNDSVESNEFTILVSSGAVKIVTSREKIVVGKPVFWKKEISLDNGENVSVQLPINAENVSVKKINTEIHVDAVLQNQTNSTNGTTNGITGQVTADIQLKKESSFSLWLKRLFGIISGNGNRFSISGKVIDGVTTTDNSAGTNVQLESKGNATQYVVEYSTAAPTIHEEENLRGKEIRISAADELNYTDVIAFTYLNNSIFAGKEKHIKVYWITKKSEKVILKDAHDVANETVVGIEGNDNSSNETISENNYQDNSLNETNSSEENTTNSSFVTGNVVADFRNENSSNETIIDANNSNLHNETISENNSQNETVNSSNAKIVETTTRQEMPFDSYDLNGDGNPDYIEWVVPHLSNQTFQIIIEISDAQHLDENRTFISDIYDSVKKLDNNWSEPIYEGEYVRVMFQQNLTNQNDITIYARNNLSFNTTVDVYEINQSRFVTEFPVIQNTSYYKIYLTNLSDNENYSQNIFDLRITDMDNLSNAFLEFDYIVDPFNDNGSLVQYVSNCSTLNTSGATYYLNQSVEAIFGTGNCFVIRNNSITLDGRGFLINYSTGITNGYAINVTGFNNITIRNVNITTANFSRSASHGIFFFNVTNSTIFNSTIVVSTNTSNAINIDSSLGINVSTNNVSNRGLLGSHAILLKYTNLSVVQNNYIWTNGSNSYGVWVQQTTFDNITGNHIQTNSTTSRAIVLTSANSTVIMSNTIIDGRSHALVLNTSSNYSTIAFNTIITNLTSSYGMWLLNSHANNISGNNITILGATGYGIAIISSSRNNISGNRIFMNTTTTTTGIILNISSNSTTIVGNIISVNHTTSNDIYAEDSLGANISSNTLRSTQGGIYLRNTNGSNILLNSITTNGTNGFGIYLLNYSNSNNISGNIITAGGTSSKGIVISMSYLNNITLNKINSTQITSQGIELNMSSNNSLIIGNTIFVFASGSNGTSLYDAHNNTVLANSIIANASTTNGISVSVSTANNLSSNKITVVVGTGSPLFLWNANRTYIGYNTLYSNDTGFVMFLNQSNANNISINTLFDNASIGTFGGIYLAGTANSNNLTGNTILISGATVNGIMLLHSNTNVIDSNYIATNGSTDYGIYTSLNVTFTNITSNIIITNGSSGFGIYLSNITTINTRVFNNTIITYGASAAGIWLPSVSANITKNKIIVNGTSAYGILAGSTLFSNITDNIITSNGTSGGGIFLNMSSNSTLVVRNIITVNGTNGTAIWIDASFRTNATSNIITTNGTNGVAIYINASANTSLFYNTISAALGDAFRLQDPRTLNTTIAINTLVDKKQLHLNITDAGLNFTNLINQSIANYSILAGGGILIVSDIVNGKIDFFVSVNGSGSNFSNDIQIMNDSISVLTNNIGLNKSANVTFYNIPTGLINYSILRDGAICAASVCSNLTSLSAGTVVINVTSWSIYRIGTNVSLAITVNSPTNTTYTNTINFTITLGVNGSSLYSLNNGKDNFTMTNSSGGLVGTVLNATNVSIASGGYRFIVYSNSSPTGINYATNYTTYVDFSVDTTSPIVTIVLPTNTTYTTSTIIFNVTISKSGSSCVYTLTNWTNNYSMTQYNATYYNATNSSVSDGSYQTLFSCNDTIGTVNNTAKISFSIDSTAPTISFVSPTETDGVALSRNNTMINVTATDNGAGLVNITIYLYNSSGALNMTNTSTSSPLFVNYTDLLNGVWFFNATATDAVNNVNSLATRNVTIDTIAPFVNITYPVNTTYTFNISALNYTANNTNLDSCWYSNSSTGIWNSTKVVAGVNFTNVATAEGSNTFIVYCNDSAANTNKSLSQVFTKNTTNPRVTINSPTNTTYSTTLNFSITLSTSGSALYSLDNGANNATLTNASGGAIGTVLNATNTSIVNGGYMFSVYANDTSGNKNYSESKAFSFDNIVPNLTFVSPTENSGVYRNRNYIEVNVTANDTGNVSNIQIRIYNVSNTLNQTNNSFNSPLYVNLSALNEGLYFYNVSVNDSANNVNNSETRNITLDRTNPLISYGVGTANDGVNVSINSIYVNVSVTETNEANITFTLDNSSSSANTTMYTTAVRAINWTSLPDGTYTYNVTIYDLATNTNATATRTIKLDSAYPKFSSFFDNNATLITNGIALFNVTLSNTNGTVFLEINSTNYTASNVTANVYNVSVNFTLNGTYSYYWGAWGNGTNTNYNVTATRYYTLNGTVDSTPPNVTIYFPRNITYITSNLPLLFNVTINKTGSVLYSLNDGKNNFTMTNSSGGAMGTLFNASNSSIADGSYKFVVYANSTLGNNNYTTSISFSTNTSKFNMNATVTDYSGRPVNITFELFDKDETTEYYNSNGTNNESVQFGAGLHTARLKPFNSTVKTIRIYNFNFTNNTQLMQFDQPNLTRGFGAMFAFNPTNQSFSYVNVTVTATSTTLMKCTNWNFTAQNCTSGKWNIYKSGLVIGQNYTFSMTSGDPGFGEINISNATHLDANYSFISNIYDNVSTLDSLFSATIPAGDYVRVTFSRNLSFTNDITVYPQNISGDPRIEIYEKNKSSVLATMYPLVDNQSNQWFLTNLSGTQDTFDLKLVNGSVQFDYIVDPTSITSCQTLNGAGTTYTLSNSVDAGGTCFNITAAGIILDGQGNTINYSRLVYGNGINISASNVTIKNIKILQNSSKKGIFDSAYGVVAMSVANVTLDNVTIITNGSNFEYGIYFSLVTLGSVTNTTIKTAGNGSSNYGVYWLTSSNGTFSYNNISTNGTTNNYGVYLENESNNNTFVGNVIYTKGTTTNNYGFYLRNVTKINLTSNNISTNGTSNNYALNLENVTFSFFTSNHFRTNGTSINTVVLMSGAKNNTFSNNILNVTGGTSNNEGFDIEDDSSDNVFTSNNIFAGVFTSSNFGIHTVSRSNNNTFNFNNVYTVGTLNNYGANILTANNTFTSNNFTTNGTTTNNFGIYLSAAGASGNIFTSNFVNTSGSTGNRGVYIQANVSANVFVGGLIQTSGSTAGVNLNTGIFVENGTQNTFTNITVNNSRGEGLRLGKFGASYNNFTNITFLNQTGLYDLNISGNVTNTYFIDIYINNYTIDKNQTSLIVRKTGVGEIKFLIAVNNSGENFTYDIQIANNSVAVNGSNLGLNVSSNITLYNLRTNFLSPVLQKNGVTCSAPTCNNFTSLNAGTVVFNVTGWTNYTISGSALSIIINITYPMNTTYAINVSLLNYTVAITGGDSCWWSNSSGLWNSSRVTPGINFTNIQTTEGSNNVTVFCNDTTNTVNATSVVFTKDTTLPSVDFVAPTEANNSFLARANIQINVTASDVNGIQNVTIYLANKTGAINLTNSSIGSPLFMNWTVTDGVWYFNASAKDNSSNVNWTESRNITVDTIFPNVSILFPVQYPLNTTYTYNVSLLNYSINDTNRDSCWYSNSSTGIWNSTKVVAGVNFTNVATTEGSNTFKVFCNDSANNVNSSSVTFTKDTFFPIFSAFYDNNASVNVNGTGLFNVTLLNTNGTVGLEINNTNYTANNVTTSVYNLSVYGLKSGVYNYYWFAWGNGSGPNYNVSATRSYTVNVSASPYPTFSSFWDNNDSLVENGTASFNVTLLDTNGTVFLEINGTNYTANNVTANVYNVSVFLQNNTYPYYWGSWGNGSSSNYNVSSTRNYFIITAQMTTCQTLWRNNTVYTLKKSISSIAGTCFDITAPNVTLNGAGFKITSNGGGLVFTYGVVTNSSNTTIANITVTKFGIASGGAGIYLNQSKQTQLIDSNISNNAFYGVQILGTSLQDTGHIISNITANVNGDDGVLLDTTNTNVIKNITANSNTGNGFTFDGANTNNVSDIISNNNTKSGVTLSSAALTNSFANLTSNSNTKMGINCSVATATRIENFTLRLNTYAFGLLTCVNGIVSYGTINSSVKDALLIYSGTSNYTFTNVTFANSNESFNDLNVSTANANLSKLIFTNTRMTNYSLSTGQVNLTMNISGAGQIQFLTGLNGSGNNLTSDIYLAFNFAEVNSSQVGLNKSANISLYCPKSATTGGNCGGSSSHKQLLREGVACPASICYNFTSLTATIVIFNVTGWSNYSLGDANHAPTNATVFINSTDGTNKTLTNLNCYANITDIDNDTINVTVEWYNNSVKTFKFDYNNSYLNGTFFNASLNNANTTHFDNWSCGMRLNDGDLSSNFTNSTTLQILNSVPVVTLSSPTDSSTTTNRSLNFSWSGSDDDSDLVVYELNVTCWAFAGGHCSLSDDRYYYNITSTSFVVPTDLNNFWDDNNYYNWSVRANDTFAYGTFAASRKVNISTLVDITLLNSSVSFGSIYPGNSNDTTTGNPGPFVIRNTGNVKSNITMNATDLWTAQANPNRFYQFKVSNYTDEMNSFNWAFSNTTYTNMPSSSNTALAIALLNYVTTNRTAQIDINITLPQGELTGFKNSSIIMLGVRSE